jgi:hypothetical protein
MALTLKMKYECLIFMFPCIVIYYTQMTNKMQLCRKIYYSLAALHVLNDIFAHRQERLNCIIVSGFTHACCCRLVSWQYSHDTSRQRHVSSDIFVHHQEHLNCIRASGITHVCHCRPVSWELLFLGCSTCFERYFRSSSGASKLYYSFWYYTRTSLPAGIMGVLPWYQPAATYVWTTRSCVV